jgi:hypothetical protein
MASFGITIFAPSGVVVESADLELKAEFRQLIDSDGGHYAAQTYDKSYSFSASGKGDECPIAAGDAISVTGASGKGIVTTATKNSKNDDFRGWSLQATIYPHAGS